MISNSYTTIIQPSTQWGTWQGWGCSLAWWANVFGTRDDIADVIFTTKYVTINGQSLPGLGLNIVRYNAGGCSTKPAGGSTMVVSPNIPHFKQISGYWLDWNSTDPKSSSWDWSVDSNQRSMMVKARDRGSNLFQIFSNSPMWWMCKNHNPSGSDIGIDDNLQSWNYQSHAVYMSTIAQYAHNNWGITFNTVEAFNEPIAGWWNSKGTQEGCHFDTGTQSTVLGYLRTELNNRGLTWMDIASSDESTYTMAISTWESFNSATKSLVNQIDVHGYEYGNGRRDVLYNIAGGTKIWNSEYGDQYGDGLTLASNLNLDFRWLHMTAWVYWQPLDSGGWGLIQSNPGDQWIGQANPKFYVVAQYSRHIRPGMTIIDGGDDNTIAAYDSKNNLLVIVTTNYQTTQFIEFDLSKFSSVGGPVTRWNTTTQDNGDKYVKYTDTKLQGKLFQSWFSVNSIQTFEIQNVVL